MNLLVGRKAKVYHPHGKFDIDSLREEMKACRKGGYEVSTIVLSTDQWLGLLALQKDFTVYTAKPETTKLFGVNVELQDTPQWCVAVIEEF